VKKEVAAVVKRAEEIAAPSSNDMFDTLYAALPPEEAAQRRTLRSSSLGQNPEETEAPPSESRHGTRRSGSHG
jgi:hypothetical protein